MLDWNVKVIEKGYIVNIFFVDDIELTIPLDDLSCIQEVSPVRISNIAIIRPPKNQTRVRIFVSNKDQPVCFTETEIVKVRKRKRFSFM